MVIEKLDGSGMQFCGVETAKKACGPSSSLSPKKGRKERSGGER